MLKKSNHLSTGIIVLFFVTLSKLLSAQGTTDLKFNEILVKNETNFMDEYGQRSSWIEVVNSSYSNVNIGGCYLTDDKENPTKYWIPSDSPETVMSPRSFVLFFADAHPSRGIFHLNFQIEEGKSIYLFDASGRNLIDELKIPAGSQPDVVYYRTNIDKNDWAMTDKSTPRSDNDHEKVASAGEKFVQHDPTGAGMVVIAMSVVFAALAILFLFYLAIGKAFHKKKTATKTTEGSQASKTEDQLSGEVNAAIAMALNLFQAEQHDYENTVLTIKKVAKTYSPWSSKIYTLRKNPRL